MARLRPLARLLAHSPPSRGRHRRVRFKYHEATGMRRSKLFVAVAVTAAVGAGAGAACVRLAKHKYHEFIFDTVHFQL